MNKNHIHWVMYAAILAILPFGCGKKANGPTQPDYSLKPPTATVTPGPPNCFPNGWTFDSGLSGWSVLWTVSGTCNRSTGAGLCFPVTVTYDAAVGSPNLGSLSVTLDFSQSGQKAEISYEPSPYLDLTNSQVCVRVRLDSGAGNGVLAMPFVKTGAGYTRIADTSITLIEGQWVSIVFSPASSDIRQIGVEISSSGSGPFGPANVHLDSYTYTMPLTATPTSTRSPTHTLSPTLTLSPTPTPTLTETPSPSPTWTGTWFTSTPTLTDTLTLSPTFTISPTYTLSPTLTDTLSPTLTATSCAAAFKTLYSFDTDTECWEVNDGLTDDDMAHGAVMGWSGVTFQTGPGAMAVSAPYSGTIQEKVQVRIIFPGHYKLSGATMSFYVRFSPEAKGTATGGAAQPFAQNDTSWNDTWINISGANMTNWTLCTWTLPSNVNLDNADRVGVHIFAGIGGGHGYVYMDQFRLVLVNTPTPTSTPTETGTPTVTGTDTPTFTGTWLTFTPTATLSPTATFTPTSTATATEVVCASKPATFAATYGFESGLDCWTDNDAGGSVDDSYTFLSTTVAHSGTHSLASQVPYSANGQEEQFQVEVPAPGIAMPGLTLSAWVRVDSAVFGSGTNCKTGLFCQSGGWVFEAGGWTDIPAANTWTHATFAFPFSISGTDPTKVLRVGLQVMNGDGGTAGTVYIDDVTVTSNPATPTPTPVIGTSISNFASTADGWTECTLSGFITPVTPGAWSGADGKLAAGCFQIGYPALGADEFVGVLKTFGTPQDWSSFTGIQFALKVANGASGYVGGATCYIKSATDSDPLGPCLTGGCWTNIDNGETWVVFTLPFNGLVTDLAQVTQIAVRYHTGAAGSSAAGDLRIDDVGLY